MFVVLALAVKRTALQRFFPLFFGMALAACMQSVDHDAVSAGKKAEEFAQITFVQGNLDSGYAFLADGTKRYVSLAQFKEVVSKLHPNAFPKTVTASEYEPMPGEKAIYIFLTGENAGAKFYYRLTMEGTATTDYKVLRFDRSGGAPAPSSDKQKLTAKK
jgi:hypothetical protein